MPSKRDILRRRIARLETRAADPERDVGYQRLAEKVWKSVDKYLRGKSSKYVFTKEDTSWSYTKEGSPVLAHDFHALPKQYAFTLILTRRKDAPSNTGGHFVIASRWITLFCLPNDFDFGIDRPDTRYMDMSDAFLVKELPVDIRPYKDTFIHEFIHYMDFKDRIKPRRGRKTYDIRKGTEKDWTLYYNDPVEFNAHFQEGAKRMYDVFKAALNTFNRKMRDLRDPQKYEKVLHRLEKRLKGFRSFLGHYGHDLDVEEFQDAIKKRKDFLEFFLDVYLAGKEASLRTNPSETLRSSFKFFLTTNKHRHFRQQFVDHLNAKYMRKFQKRMYQFYKKMLSEADKAYMKWLPYSYTQLYLR